LQRLASDTGWLMPFVSGPATERKDDDNMKPKNTICLWFDKDAEEAARFYATTFPDSKVTAVHKAPLDYPGGKKGDVLTVEFTAGHSLSRSQRWSGVQAHGGVFFPGRDRESGGDGPLLERARR